MIKEPLTQCELYKITMVSILSTLVCQRLFPDNTFAEFCFLAIPQYIAILYIKYSNYLYLALIIALLIPKRATSRCVGLKEEDNITPSIDVGRYIIISIVVIAIFTADFPRYDAQSHKLGKSMDYGLQLMDIGVGSFVFNAGFFSPKMTLKRKFKNILQSLIFGFARFFTKVYFKLDVDEREFGTHLNFFFLLAMLNLLSICFTVNSGFLVGTGLCLIHEILLKYAGVKNVLYNTTRSNLLMANIEGISFILPQYGMFLMAGAVGRCVFGMKSKKLLPTYWIVSVILLTLSLRFSMPNRRLHNLSFCMVIVVLHTTIGFAIYLINILADTGTDMGLRKYGSRNMLFILVWSNLCVFLRNLIVDTKTTSELTNHLLFLTYYAMVLLFPSLLFRRSVPIPRKAIPDYKMSKGK